MSGFLFSETEFLFHFRIVAARKDCLVFVFVFVILPAVSEDAILGFSEESGFVDF